MIHLQLEQRLREAVAKVLPDANLASVLVRPCPDPKFGVALKGDTRIATKIQVLQVSVNIETKSKTLAFLPPAPGSWEDYLKI